MGGMSGVTFLPLVVVALAGRAVWDLEELEVGGTWVRACLGRRLDSLSTGTVSTGTESEILVHFYFVLNTVLSP